MEFDLALLKQVNQLTRGLGVCFWVLLAVDAILVGLIIVTRMLT